MNDSAESRVFPLFVEDRDRIGLRFASVNRDREPSLTRHSQLPFECFALHLTGRVVVMKIQTDLAPGDHLWVLREILELLVQLFVEQSSFVRVNADSRVDEGILFSYSKRGRVRVCGYFAITHAHDYLDSGVKRPLNDGFAVGVKLGSLEVRV